MKIIGFVREGYYRVLDEAEEWLNKHNVRVISTNMVVVPGKVSNKFYYTIVYEEQNVQP